jgi:hypothetical protein
MPTSRNTAPQFGPFTAWMLAEQSRFYLMLSPLKILTRHPSATLPP